MGVKTTDIGDIPSLSMLQYLDLSNNKEIKAILPQSIQNLKNLTTLILIGCSFRGPIPDSIGSLKQLVFLGLNNNSFTGPIPPSIGNLNNLSWLDLSDNQLSGPIPVSNPPAPGLDNLMKTKHFHLSNNQLSGPIRSKLFNSNMSLIHLRLDSNSLVGEVPEELANLESLSELYLSNNNLNGSVPELLGMNSIFYVDMSNNSFDKSDIPAWITLPSLTTMVLSSNRISGTLDVGNRYSSDLIVDLTNNSITTFTQSSGYNLSLNLDNNPICEDGATGRYCSAGKPDPPDGLPSNECAQVRCGSNKVLSPNCKCSSPYTGTIFFFSHSFSNLDNTTYYTTLRDTLISAFRSNQLPVDSVSISNPTIGEYLQYRLHIFPSGEDYFTRSAVSSIGTVINRQLFSLPYYGPSFFLDESYCCFPASWGFDSSDAGDAPQLKGTRWCSFEELQRATNRFSEENIIGSGGYGKVYKGTLDSGHVVAIKRAQQGSLQGAQEFKTEIELLSRIHHKNVVSLVGFCYEQGEQMLVYEYISNGSLKDNLSVCRQTLPVTKTFSSYRICPLNSRYFFAYSASFLTLHIYITMSANREKLSAANAYSYAYDDDVSDVQHSGIRATTRTDAEVKPTATSMPCQHCIDEKNEKKRRTPRERLCYYCHLPGHQIYMCKAKENDEATQLIRQAINAGIRKQEDDVHCREEMVVTGTDSGQWKEIWYVNPTFNHHFVGNLDVFKRVKHIMGVETRSGMNNFVFIRGVGTVEMKMGTETLNIPSVFYSPDIDRKV
ncbi:putative protein kinase RLK-Pelle-LRR-VIII-1 family [Helianthus annuus]|uniref:Protein kinase domain-containing protein n=1 Tax=Helianthus annuus TaxID=4232 RepID=A0A9K3IU45_HELAN|nr:putative protein kinase RLK-Pelle-LRR-VIII-1 family [Helianthus annuus]